MEFSKSEIFGISQIFNFSEFSKLEIFGVFQNNFFFRIFEFGNYWNLPNWKMYKFLKKFPIWKTNIWLQKLSNFRIVRPFDILHYSKFCQFSYLPLNINQFSQFLYPILVIYKFGCSIFERSLTFEFETSTILKFYCLKLQLSSASNINKIIKKIIIIIIIITSRLNIPVKNLFASTLWWLKNPKEYFKNRQNHHLSLFCSFCNFPRSILPQCWL